MAWNRKQTAICDFAIKKNYRTHTERERARERGICIYAHYSEIRKCLNHNCLYHLSEVAFYAKTAQPIQPYECRGRVQQNEQSQDTHTQRERQRESDKHRRGEKSIHTAHKLFNYLNLQFYYTVGRSKLKLKWKRTEEKDGKSVAMILRTHTKKHTIKQHMYRCVYEIGYKKAWIDVFFWQNLR